jgi:hypothetical protein
MHDFLWFPSDAEIMEILGSAVVSRDWQNGGATQFNRIENGVKTRLAVIARGEFQIEECVILCTEGTADMNAFVSSELDKERNFGTHN